MFRWEPETLLALIYGSAERAKLGWSGVASGTYVAGLRFTAFGRRAITVTPEND